MEELRVSLPGDEPELRELWRRAGGPEAPADVFFDGLYEPGMASVALRQGRIVSAAYAVRLGDLVSDGRWTPCKLLFAPGPDPAALPGGREVLEHACRRAATGVTAVRAADPALCGLYGDLGFRPWFSCCERACTDVGSPLYGTVTRVTVRGYAALREELLYGRPHIDYDIRFLEYRERLLARSGGGFYYLVSDGIRCCAALELTEDQALIRELIVPTGSQYNAAVLASRALRRERFVYRAPVRPGDASAPFAMLLAPAAESKPDLPPWFGFELT